MAFRTVCPRRSARRSRSTASSSGAAAVIAHGVPITRSGTAIPAPESIVAVMSGSSTMWSRWVEAAPTRCPAPPGVRHIATRRCGTPPWSESPASRTAVSAGSRASTCPTFASAAATAAARPAGGSRSGSLVSASPSRYGRIRSSTSTASSGQRDHSAAGSASGVAA